MHLEPKAAHQNNGGYADTELGQQTTAHSGQGLIQGGQPIGRQISVTLSQCFQDASQGRGTSED